MQSDVLMSVLDVLKMLIDGSVSRDCYLQYSIENNVAYERNGLIVLMFLCFEYIRLAVTAYGCDT